MTRPKSGSREMAADETDLIVRAQAGDMSAFEELVFRHDRQVLGIVARFVSSSDDAKDLYQEVFLRVYRGLKGFRFQSEFSTWVFRITTNLCLSHRARQKKIPFVVLEDRHQAENDGGHMQAGDVPPDERTMNVEIAMHVEQALNSLSPKQRIVFTLKHYQGYTLKEIASMMGCMEGTVKRYLFNATRRMRDQLKDVV